MTSARRASRTTAGAARSRRAAGGSSTSAPRAACGDGTWNASCPANPALNEKCDPSAGAAGKKGSCGANEGCDGSCKCVTCACGPNTATPTCPVGELGGYCGPEDCQCHAGCLDEFDCPGGKECVNKTCVGAGALRFTIDWKFDTDLDLHVLTPLGNEIYYGNRSVDGGTLDVDTCVSSCTSGTENVFFQEAPVGHYEAWVQNFNGRKGGRFKLEISNGAATLPKYLFLPAAVGGTQHYSFEVSPR